MPHAQGHESPPAALTTGKAARYLCCSGFTVHKLLRDRHFPNAYRVGKHWRIPVADLDAYRQSTRVGGAA